MHAGRKTLVSSFYDPQAEHSGSTIRSVVLSVSSATQSMSMSALPTPSPSASFVARLQSQARITVTTLAGNITTPGYFDETGVAARFSQPRGVVLGPNASYLVVVSGAATCVSIEVICRVQDMLGFFCRRIRAMLVCVALHYLRGSLARLLERNEQGLLMEPRVPRHSQARSDLLRIRLELRHYW